MQSVAALANRNTAGGLIEKQSIQAMAVGNWSKTAAEGCCKIRLYIAASGQLHPLGYISVGAVAMTAGGHFDRKLFLQRRIHETKYEDLPSRGS